MPAAQTVYLIPDDAKAVVHVNATDLFKGTAKVGPVWKASGYIPLNASCTPVPSVGPFGNGTILSPLNGGPGPWDVGALYTLQAPNPLNFLAGQSFCLTVLASFPTTYGESVLQSNPLLVEAGNESDPNGFWIEANYGPPQVNFSALSASVGETIITDKPLPDNTILGPLLVISAGYDGSTNNLFLKVNNRTIITGNLGAMTQPPVTPAFIGNFFDGSAYYPLGGQFYEFLASTNTPSDAFFTTLYSSVQANLATFSLIPNPYSTT